MATATRPGGMYVEQHIRTAKKFDFWLILSSLALLAIGLMSLFSQQLGTSQPWFKKQLINVAIGLVPFSMMLLIHPRVWQRYATVLYGVNLALLGAVLFLGKASKGAQRWVDIGPMQFQPSELAKLLIVFTLAAFFASRQDKIQGFSTFALSLAHVFVPLALILKQPHLGASLVLLVIWFAISLVANVPLKYLIGTIAVALSLLVMVVKVPALSGVFLHDYQIERLQGLKDKTDTQGKNYQTDRAEIAFGVGGVMGTGFGRGQQKQGGFIPEQQNDFIFTIVGEEGGLIGCTMVLAAFAVFFYRIWLIMLHATDAFYRMLAGGVFAMLAFHTVVNICMVLQILPVVGLWLPFLSYGGTAIWLCVACVGLMMNLRSREKPLLF